MNTFTKAVRTEASWGKTSNGADALTTTLNAALDMFGRSGAMRNASVQDRQTMIAKAYNENADIAMKLLFFTRDVRGGYGERDTFTDMVKWVASTHPDSVKKNLWGFLEYGRAKDLYTLQGTKCEAAMWDFMKSQFELDYANMVAGKSCSLLAKWIATPDASSANTRALGQLTLRKLGYTSHTEREYKKILRALRRYINIPEALMAAGKWSEIEYSKLGSQCLIKHRQAFARNDAERYAQFIEKAANGEVKMNTGAMTPVDIIHNVFEGRYTSDLETMWSNLPDYCKGNAIVMCDTSGSMTWAGNPRPIEVAMALSMYFAERNKGELKNTFFTFETNPHLVTIEGTTLEAKTDHIMSANWGGSTNLAAAFDKLLDICKDGNVDPADMPEAIVIVSDMQINCVNDIRDGRITFYESMNKRFEEAGYKMPQIVFWNVNAVNPTFHASAIQGGATMVSGYAPAIFKTVMENIGKTPIDVLNEAVITNVRYAKVTA